MSANHPKRSSAWSMIAEFTTRHAIFVGLVAGLFALLAFFSVQRLRPTASIESMLADDQPSAVAMRSINQRFGTLEELIVVASVPPTVDDTEAPELLLQYARNVEQSIRTSATLATMCDSIQYHPTDDMRAFVETVIIPHALFYLSDQNLTQLLERLKPASMQEQLRRTEELISIPGAGGTALRRTALADPLSLRDFLIKALPVSQSGDSSLLDASDGYFSQDRRHLLIRLHGTRPASDLEFAKSFTERVKILAQQNNHASLEISITGSYAIAAAAAQSIRSDMIRSITLSVIFLQILYLLAYRSLWSLPAALAPVTLGLLLAFGVYAALGMNLSPMTAVIGAILAGLGIDYCIHGLTHYQSSRADGGDHRLAIGHTLNDIGPALVAACITTTIGFVAISQSSVQALKEFGLLGAMGLIASLLAAILVLPSILALSSHRKTSWAIRTTGKNSMVSPILRHCAHHRWKCVTLGTVATLTAVVYLNVRTEPRALFEDDLTVMHPRPNPALDVQKQLSEWFAMATDSMLIHLDAETDGDLVTRAHRVRKAIDQVAESSKIIRGSFGLASLLPDPAQYDSRRSTLAKVDTEQILSDFDAAVSKTNFREDAFGRYRQFLQTLLSVESNPQLRQLSKFPTLASTVLPIRSSGSEAPSAQTITAVTTDGLLDDRAKRNKSIVSIRNAIDSIPGATLTGMSVLGYDTEFRIRQDLAKLISIAGIAVGIWLLLYFRSATASLLAFLPAVFGMILFALAALLLDLKLNTMNLIALPLLVGIGVDDGIFLVTAARASRRNNESREECINRLATGCHAIGMTSLTTILTFGTLIFTSTPAIQSLGWLMGIGVSASFVGSICILAPILAGGSRKENTLSSAE